MTERIIEQAINAIDDGNVIEALEFVDDTVHPELSEGIKEDVVRQALAERAFDELSIGDFIRNRKIQRLQRKLPRHIDDEVNRDMIREAVARRYRYKHSH